MICNITGGPELTITIGRNGGVVQSGSKKLKGNDLMVNKYWKLMGQIPPGKGAPKRAKTMKAGGNRPAQTNSKPVARTKSMPATTGGQNSNQEGKQTAPPGGKGKQKAPSGGKGKQAPVQNKQKGAVGGKQGDATKNKQK